MRSTAQYILQQDTFKGNTLNVINCHNYRSSSPPTTIKLQSSNRSSKLIKWRKWNKIECDDHWCRKDLCRINIGHKQTVKATSSIFKSSARSGSLSVIIDPDVCDKVVGKGTLNSYMIKPNMDKVEETSVRLQHLRFGNYNDDSPSLFAIKMPFFSREQISDVNVEFDVLFDVIDGNRLFLCRLPSFIAMSVSISQKWMTLAFSWKGQHYRLPL